MGRICSVLLVLLVMSACATQRFPLAEPSDPPDSTSFALPTHEAQATPGDLDPGTRDGIARVWANDGGGKVTRDELRATNDPNSVHNSAWDGTTISLFGARNEVVSFNLVLEAPATAANGVVVRLEELAGSDGAVIGTRAASGEELFDYVGRNIELFFVRYLEIKGLSVDLAYDSYDERHIPERCRRAYDEEGVGSGTWDDRPCHNKLYPEIAVPLELHTPFAIPAGSNQSIWGDVYIPKDTAPGTYGGTVAIYQDGSLAWEVPIQLSVRDFALPDLPSARTMLDVCLECINERYFGEENAYPEPGSDVYRQGLELANRHLQLAHRHKISLIDGGDIEPREMDEMWTASLSGELFTAARGYDGIGTGVGNNVYSIGTYGSWGWQDGGEAEMWANADAWVNWFEAQSFSTPTDYFLYLSDESEDYAQTERWAQWLNSNPGPGRRLMSMATIDIAEAADHTPSLDIAAFGAGYGLEDRYQAAADLYAGDTDRRFYVYNGSRPATGSFAIEDDGVALRQLGWTQVKKQVDRWSYWASTYYQNWQCYGYDDPEAQTNVFQQAQTFGCYELDDYDDEALGQAGWNYFNGDGVLFYPGTDMYFARESYGLMGPIASLRLKHWRRGIQDADYLALAAQIDPVRTAELVNEMVPRVLWEVGVEDPEDPTWVRTDVSWPTDPDAWESARAELASIIEAHTE